MELTPKQQIVELVGKSKRILVLSHVNPDGDALGSVLALTMALKKIDKEVTAVCQDVIPSVFKFLPQIDIINPNFHGQRDFIISVNTSKAQIEKLGYKQHPEEGRLDIVITPKSGGNLTKEDVTITPGSAKYDLIFTLDSPEIDRVGSIYDENPDVFYEVPIINIDHHGGNNYFGKVNWVDLTATSTAEILVSLLESLGREKSLFDSEIATALLAGIITDTGSFQHNNTTPKSFTVAAQLVAAGGRQQEIVQHVFKTKPLSTLKLWGKVLSNIREEKKHRFVWSEVQSSDYLMFEAQDNETSGVIDELLKTVPDIDFAMLMTERQGGLNVSLRGVGKGNNVAEIAQMFGGGGHELAAAFQMPNTTLAQSKDQILVRIKEFQAKKMGLISDAPVYNDNIRESFDEFSNNKPLVEDRIDSEDLAENINDQITEVPLDQIDVT